jgi:hypothetical protein
MTVAKLTKIASDDLIDIAQEMTEALKACTN